MPINELLQKIVSQLKQSMLGLRSINGNFIGSVDGSACENPVFYADPDGFGSHQTEDEFNQKLIRAMNIDRQGSWTDHVG
jgi:hypothetical protein